MTTSPKELIVPVKKSIDSEKTINNSFEKDEIETI
jgi:hypothetical protein